MKFDSQVNSVVKSCFLHLHLLSKIKPFFSFQDFERVIHVFISSCLDYCNSLYCRGVKYLSNFTWLLYLSIILGDLYFIQVQCKLTTCTFTWLHFWRKNSTFYSLQFYFILKSTLHFYFILCTLHMINGSSNMRAWCENQWSLFHASSTHISTSFMTFIR